MYLVRWWCSWHTRNFFPLLLLLLLLPDFRAHFLQSINRRPLTLPLPLSLAFALFLSQFRRIVCLYTFVASTCLQRIPYYNCALPYGSKKLIQKDPLPAVFACLACLLSRERTNCSDIQVQSVKISQILLNQTEKKEINHSSKSSYQIKCTPSPLERCFKHIWRFATTYVHVDTSPHTLQFTQTNVIQVKIEIVKQFAATQTTYNRSLLPTSTPHDIGKTARQGHTDKQCVRRVVYVAWKRYNNYPTFQIYRPLFPFGCSPDVDTKRTWNTHSMGVKQMCTALIITSG